MTGELLKVENVKKHFPIRSGLLLRQTGNGLGRICCLEVRPSDDAEHEIAAVGNVQHEGSVGLGFHRLDEHVVRHAMTVSPPL